jgi:phage terminase large subunit-like protein
VAIALTATAPYTVEHFRGWSSQLICDNEEPFELELYQERFLEDVFAGFPICWLIVPEGNGKSTFFAALAMYAICHTGGIQIPIAASALDQARVIYQAAEGFVWRSKVQYLRCFEGFKQVRCAKTHSRMQIFPGDDRTGDGIIPGKYAGLDELHRHRSLALYETWKGKLGKLGAQLIVISTAGEVGSEFELERERLRQEATHVDRIGRAYVRAEMRLNGKPISVMHEYGLTEGSDIDDLELVKEANPLSFITVETLAEKRAGVRNNQHWSRFSCNLATRSVSAAISEIDWHRARVSDEIPAKQPIWLGLDLGWQVDPTAIVPLWWRDNEFRLLGPATVILPPRDGTHTSPRIVENALREIYARNPIELVVMDMTGGEQLASWIEEELGATVVDRDQRLPSQVLDHAYFTEALREGWLKHTGDPALTRHVLNAIGRVLPGGDIVFARPKESRTTSNAVQAQREIDALVAAAMVHMTKAMLDEPAEPMFSFS